MQPTTDTARDTHRHYAVTVTRRIDRPHRSLGSYTIHVDPTAAPPTDRLAGDRATYNNRETRRGVYGTLDDATPSLHGIRTHRGVV